MVGFTQERGGDPRTTIFTRSRKTNPYSCKSWLLFMLRICCAFQHVDLWAIGSFQSRIDTVAGSMAAVALVVS